MIAAGVNAKALSTYIGHACISITMDRYGHLMPGSEAEAAGRSVLTWKARHEPRGEGAAAPRAMQARTGKLALSCELLRKGP